MNLSVHYIDTNGKPHDYNYQMSRLAFAKHLAIAGQGYAPNIKKIWRTVGMFLHYNYYLQRNAFNSDRFSEPPAALSDPTDKGQFSNLAGKAIADFLSKRIDKSLYTVNYEAAMRLHGYRIKGSRPDLIAYTQNSVFAIEAKGRHQRSAGKMSKHKTQAQSGPIKVNFHVACVSFNIFKRVTCNYHDPFNDNIPFDNISLSDLTKSYYRGLSEFLNPDLFEYRELTIQGEKFYEVELFNRQLRKIYFEEFHFSQAYLEFFDFFHPRLILPGRIRDYAENGISNNTIPFEIESNETQTNIYIDNDRVGLRIRDY